MAIISDDDPSRASFVTAGDVASLMLSLVAIPAIVIFIWQRYEDTQARRYSVASVACFVCYISSLSYMVAVTLLLHLRLKVTHILCDSILMVCIVLHAIAKGAEFLFLVERVYIISWTTKPRRRSWQYVLSIVLIILPYTAFNVVTIINRYTLDLDRDICVIGIKFAPIVSVVSLEVVAQLYFTIRFLWPLFTVHRNIKGLVQPLRQLILRTCIGSAVTLATNIAASVSVAIWLGEEPAWLCALTCKASIFIAACMLHWITRPIQSASREHSRQQGLGVGFDGSAVALPHHSSFPQPPISAKELAVRDISSFYKYSPSVTVERQTAATA